MAWEKLTLGWKTTLLALEMSEFSNKEELIHCWRWMCLIIKQNVSGSEGKSIQLCRQMRLVLETNLLRARDRCIWRWRQTNLVLEMNGVHDNSLQPTRCQQLVVRQLVAVTSHCSDNSLRDISLRDNSLQRQMVAKKNHCNWLSLFRSGLFWFLAATLAGHDAIITFSYCQGFSYQPLTFEMLKISM